MNNFEDDNNFYVTNPALILKQLTGKNWDVRKEKPTYKKKENEYIVEFWSINGTSGHFARIEQGYNSLQKSNCVNKGKIHSLRVCKVL